MRPSNSSIEIVAYVAEHLGPLRSEVTFLGGAITPLLLTEPGARPPRPTKDVDVIVELASQLDYYRLESKLRNLGFLNAIEGPICRFVRDSFVLDVMPTDPAILGFANRWYPAAIRTATSRHLSDGLVINLISPACFLATKLEAFDSADREDHGDMPVSRDFEDIVTLIDGRSEIVGDVETAEEEINEYLRTRFRKLMAHPEVFFGIQAHVEEGRIDIVLKRIESISK